MLVHQLFCIMYYLDYIKYAYCIYNLLQCFLWFPWENATNLPPSPKRMKFVYHQLYQLLGCF